MKLRDSWDLLKASALNFLKDDCPRLAAALSYFTVFSLPPLFALMLMLAGVIWDPQQVQTAIAGQVGDLIGAEGEKEISAMIAHKTAPGERGPFATLIGLLLLIYGATGAFLNLQESLNRAWNVEPDPSKGGLRNFITKRIFSFGMILAIVFIMLVSLSVSAALSGLADYFAGGSAGIMLQTLEFVVSFAVIAVLFAAMYKVMPDAIIAWRDVWVGSIVTTVLFVLGKFAIGFYLGQSDPAGAFGAAGSLALILIWIYYASMIVLFGAEFTQAWATKYGGGIRPEHGATAVVEEKRKVRPETAEKERMETKDKLQPKTKGKTHN